jgi:hypothetical protein
MKATALVATVVRKRFRTGALTGTRLTPMAQSHVHGVSCGGQPDR